MIRRRAVHVVLLSFAVVAALTACTTAPAPTPSVSAAPTTSSPAPTPSPSPTVTPTPTPTGPKLPAVRWDKVPRGRLPSGCVTVGSTLVSVSGHSVHGRGPALTCRSGSYWVRALVKVAVYHGHGRWSYITPAHPSAPQRNSAAVQRSPVAACPSGRLVRAVASFVLTDPHGHQVRYRRIGSSTRCP